VKIKDLGPCHNPSEDGLKAWNIYASLLQYAQLRVHALYAYSIGVSYSTCNQKKPTIFSPLKLLIHTTSRHFTVKKIYMKEETQKLPILVSDDLPLFNLQGCMLQLISLE
jgi:hypothetical protein